MGLGPGELGLTDDEAGAKMGLLLARGTTVAASPAPSINGSTYKPAVGDFDGQLKDDLLVRPAGTNDDLFWWATRR